MVAALTEAVFACECWVTTHKQQCSLVLSSFVMFVATHYVIRSNW